MIITFPIRTLGGTAMPEVTDNPVHIPPTIQPTIVFPGPLAAVNPPISTIQIATVLSYTQHDHAASTLAFSVGLASFGAGLWEIQIMFRVTADFNQTPNTASPFQVFLQNPTANTFAPLVASGATIGTRTDYYKDTFNFADSNWQIFAQSIATAAAQTYEFIVSVYGKRLA